MERTTIPNTDAQHSDSVSARLDELEGTVAQLKAAEQIRDFHHQYVRALADRHFDTLLSYFDDDAVIDMRSHGVKHGKTEIAEHFEPLHRVIADGCGYIVSSPVIKVHGDRATSEWTWHRLLAGEAREASTDWLEGRYHCEYVLRPDGWKFARMRFRVVLPNPDPQ